MSLATDRLLEKLFLAVERQVGADNYLVVFTADHGVSPVPEVNAARKMPGGRIDPASIKAAVQGALVKKYGPGEWVSGNWDLAVYLNQGLIAESKLDLGEVEREAARAIQAMPHVSRVYTLQQMTQGGVLNDAVSQKVANGFNVRRGPDVELIPDPYWMVKTGLGTSHASPYGYDTHVPVIFMGTGIRAGQYRGIDRGERYRSHAGRDPGNRDAERVHRARADGNSGELEAPASIIGVMDLRPLHDRVMVKRLDEGEQKLGGIIIPDSAKEKPQQALVKAVGNGKLLDSGERVALDLKAGDRILFGKYSGAEIKIDGEEYLILKEDEILGVLE